MNSPHKLRWSDIWLLVATYFCRAREQCRLRDVIAAADAMNHSIMNFEEISSGLVRLTGHGLVTVGQNPWRVTCTKKGLNAVEPAANRNSLALRVWQDVERTMKVKPWTPRDPLPDPENSLRYPGFEIEDYKHEIAEYLAAMDEIRIGGVGGSQQ